MSQGAYSPAYEPEGAPPRHRPPDQPEAPSGTRGTARVPQPPAWGPPQPPPAPGGYGGGFGGPPQPGAPQSGPPASGPPPSGTYGTPSYGGPAQPPYAGPEPGRFAGLRYDDPAIEAPARSKRGLIIGIVIAAVVVLVVIVVGVFLVLSKTSSSNSFAVGSCVKRADDKAISVACTDASAYRVMSKVDTVDKCPDKGQPYVVLQESGKADQVLCLKPAH